MKISYSLLLCSFLFIGCGSKNPTFGYKESSKINLEYDYSKKSENYQKSFFLVNSIKLDYEDSLYKISNFQMPNSNIPGINHNLAWIAGPDPTLSKDMFEVKKYSEDTLIEVGFGINNKLDYIFKKVYGLENVEEMSKNAGYDSFNAFYSMVFERVSNKSTQTLIRALVEDDKNGKITKENVLVSVSAFKTKLDKFVLYSNEEYFYYMFQDEAYNLSKISHLMDKSNFYVLDKYKSPIQLTSQDYEIYAFVMDLCYEYLIKHKKGGSLYVL